MVENNKYNFLKFINLKNLTNWNVKRITFNLISNAKYPMEEIGNLLKRIKIKESIDDSKEYKRIKIKTNAEGVEIRDIITGNNIGTKEQYIVSEGQLVLSKIDARNGAFGIVPTVADKAIITSNFWAYDINLELINPKYLVLILSSENFVKNWYVCSNGSGNRLYLQEKLFLKTKIPLPSLKIQEQIIDNYSKKIEESEEKEKQADKLENDIEQYLFKKLKISKIIEKKVKGEKYEILEFKKLTEFNNWSISSNNKISNSNILKSSFYDNVPISYVAKINPITKFPKEIKEISFLPMDSISQIYGEISYQLERKVSECKGYTKFIENDILWAKITPCMQNGKCTIARNLKNGFGVGSTEFHVIRCDSSKVIIDYIYILLRTNIVRSIAQNYFSGSAGQQRVPKSYIEDLIIPLPPIDIQKTIVNKVLKLKKQIKANRKNAQQLEAEAKKSLQTEIFGNM